ncbi:uncharacterized protein LOC132036366 isoform X1 [Lycium ferocissimum]|uniref:uncharacterized protein LOC132036366 isoform X1 n=2 Tax=Lycium ferocissimum TaxID=112874 RepID=UPI00281516B7|nr:uncharacterized protein LOC132036366 isoform X1 [Lycium ferocissimum]
MEAYHVSWSEVWDKGRREVHYYLKRRDGRSDLAVVGKDKSYHYAIKDLSLFFLSNSSSLPKLRSRIDVIHWLNSIVRVSDSDTHKADGPNGGCSDSKNTSDVNSGVLKNVQMSFQGKDATEFMWLGSPWTCRKKRKHYQSFNRNGVIVSVHEFVYVLAEEDKKLVAHLDDIYEDSRGNRMVVVRWFHKIDEVGIVLPHNYNDREIFFSLCLQTLSIECIDGLASVLSPQHYEKFLSEVRHTQVKPFVCRWQFDNDDLQPFDITRSKGYWDQDIIKYLSFQSPARIQPACDGLKGGGDIDAVGSRPKKRLRLTKAGDTYKLSTQRKETVKCGLKDINNSLKEGWSNVSLPAKDVLEHSRYFPIGAQVEILSQDSGIRGCWLRATIIKKHKNKVKVQYQDIKDADDEAKNLEEWVLTSKLAAVDAFGARISGRSILRPSPMSYTGKVSWAVNIGCIVDAWWHNGWWEGIVVEKESEDKLHVYLLGEKQEMIFGRGDLRHSQEWLEDGWRNLKESPELVSALAAVKVNQVIDDSCHSKQEQTAISDGQELSSVPYKNNLDNTSITGLDFQENKIEEPTVVRDLSKDNLLAQLRWKSSGKRRHCRSPVHKVHFSVNKSQNSRDLVRGSGRKFLFPSTKVDTDNCKYISDSVFTSVVSPLTSLVMSR